MNVKSDPLTTETLYANCLQGLRAIINPEPFVRWLEKQPPDRLFGGSADNCPLAQWSGHSVGYLTYGCSYLPPWAIAFVQDFCMGGGPRTVRRALQIMRAQS